MDEKHIARMLQEFAATLERMRLNEYLDYVTNQKRVLLRSFLLGAARGIGFAVGFSLLGAIATVLVSHLVVENVPVIGGFLAEVVYAVEQRLK